MTWQIDVIVTEGAPRLKDVRQRLVLVDKRSSFGPATVVMWFSLIAAAVILMAVLASRFKRTKSPEYGKQPAGAG